MNCPPNTELRFNELEWEYDCRPIHNKERKTMFNPVATAIATGWIVTLDEAVKAGVPAEVTGALAQAAAHAAYLLINGEEVAGVSLKDQECSDNIINDTLGNKWDTAAALGTQDNGGE